MRIHLKAVAFPKEFKVHEIFYITDLFRPSAVVYYFLLQNANEMLVFVLHWHLQFAMVPTFEAIMSYITLSFQHFWNVNFVNTIFMLHIVTRRAKNCCRLYAFSFFFCIVVCQNSQLQTLYETFEVFSSRKLSDHFDFSNGISGPFHILHEMSALISEPTDWIGWILNELAMSNLHFEMGRKKLPSITFHFSIIHQHHDYLVIQIRPLHWPKVGE